MTKKLLVMPIYLLILIGLLHMSSNFVDAIRWNDDICSGDNMMITFSKCCGNEPYCSSKTKESECNDGEFGLYCDWMETDGEGEDKAGKCAPKLDERSDVCCRGGAIKDACHSIAYKMECPKDWLVNKGCCPDSAERKYNKILDGIPEDMDCCNSPCTQVEKAISSGTSNCTLSSRCAPGPRSYSMTYDPYHTLGFFHNYRHGAPHTFGSIIHGSGYDNYGYEDDEYGYGEKDDEYDSHDDSKHGYKDHDDHYDHVDEITVDDLFELMIEALEDDTDVKSYDAEYYTDSYLGKTKSGGLLADLNLPHPDDYIDLLYGNPWGLNYNLDYEFKNPIGFYSSPYDYGNYPSNYGPHYGPSSYGAFNPYSGTPQAGYGGVLDHGYTSPPQMPYQQPYGNAPQAAYNNPSQYGNSPQPAYPDQAQQYGNSPSPAYHKAQYGNSPQPSYPDQAQYGNSPQPSYPDQAQYGNSPQPTYHNQPQASNMYGDVNQYSVEQKSQYQQPYQQQPQKVNVQQARPIQQTIAVNDNGVKYNQYSHAAAGHQIVSQPYAAPPIYR